MGGTNRQPHLWAFKWTGPSGHSLGAFWWGPKHFRECITGSCIVSSSSTLRGYSISFSCVAALSHDVPRTFCGCYWVAKSSDSVFQSKYTSQIVGMDMGGMWARFKVYKQIMSPGHLSPVDSSLLCSLVVQLALTSAIAPLQLYVARVKKPPALPIRASSRPPTSKIPRSQPTSPEVLVYVGQSLFTTAHRSSYLSASMSATSVEPKSSFGHD